MQAHELDKCERRAAELKEAIARGGLSQRDYDSRCGELAGISWVIRELHLRPNQPGAAQRFDMTNDGKMEFAT